MIPARGSGDLITGGAVIARLCQVQLASFQIFAVVTQCTARVSMAAESACFM